MAIGRTRKRLPGCGGEDDGFVRWPPVARQRLARNFVLSMPACLRIAHPEGTAMTYAYARQIRGLRRQRTAARLCATPPRRLPRRAAGALAREDRPQAPLHPAAELGAATRVPLMTPEAIVDQPISRRSAVLTALAAALGSTAALAAMTTEAEARRGGWKGGRGRGWAMGRGRKRGWSKRGGPRWWRGF